MPHNGKRIGCWYPLAREPWNLGTDPIYINLLKGSPSFWRPEFYNRMDDNGYLTEVFTVGGHWPGLGFPVHNPDKKPGNYILRGKGQGSLRWANANYEVPGSHGTINQWEIRVPYNLGVANVTFYATDPPPNHIRDLVVMHQYNEQDYHNGFMFDRDFRERMKEFGVVRLQPGVGTHGGPLPVASAPFTPLEAICYHKFVDPRRCLFDAHKDADDPWMWRAEVPRCGPVAPGQVYYVPAGSLLSNTWLQVCQYLYEPGPTTWLRVFCWTSADMVSEWPPSVQIDFDFDLYKAGINLWISASSSTHNFAINQAHGQKVLDVRPATFVYGDTTYQGAELELEAPLAPAASLSGRQGDWIDITVWPNYAQGKISLKLGNAAAVPAGAQCDSWYWQYIDNFLAYGNRNSIAAWASLWFCGGFDCFLNEGGWPAQVQEMNSFAMPPLALIKLCNEIGAHPEFMCTPIEMSASDAAARPRRGEWPSANYRVTKDQIGNYVREVALLCKQHLDPGLVPIFSASYGQDGQFGANILYQPVINARMASALFGPSGTGHEHDAAMSSLIGQTVAEVYGVHENDVHTQRPERYRNNLYIAWDELKANNANLRFGIGGGQWIARGGDPAPKWCTHLSMQSVCSSAYGRRGELRLQGIANYWNQDRAGRSYLIDHVIDSIDPPMWDSTTPYLGPQPDGTTDVVWWEVTSTIWYDNNVGWVGAGIYVFFALTPSTGQDPVATRGVHWQMSVVMTMPATRQLLPRFKALRDQHVPALRLTTMGGGWYFSSSNPTQAAFVNELLMHPRMKEVQLKEFNMLKEHGIESPFIYQIIAGLWQGSQAEYWHMHTNIPQAEVLSNGLYEDTPIWDAIVQFNEENYVEPEPIRPPPPPAEEGMDFPRQAIDGYRRWGREWVAARRRWEGVYG